MNALRIGRYSVLEPIGAGGCATVHLAQMVGPLGFSRTLAIKRLHSYLAADSDLAIALLDEARLTSRIRSPFVVPTLDVVSEAGELLIVMEYVLGESLAKLTRVSASELVPLEADVASAIMSDVLHGLHAAHELTSDTGSLLDVVHRDVSPQNIMVGADGISRLLDFGVAKAMGRVQTTREGQLKGKMPYMSPEQVRGERLDRRTDLFAASIVLWEALTGERLFAAIDVRSTMAKVLAAKVAPPSSRRAGVPRAIDAVVMKGLAMNREERHPTALAMAEALEAAVRPAPRAKVIEWMLSVCREDIEQRRRRMAELDAHTIESTAPEGISVEAGERTGSAQDLFVGAESERHSAEREPSKRSLRLWPAAIAGALAIAAGVFGVIATRRGVREPAAQFVDAGVVEVVDAPIDDRGADAATFGVAPVAHLPSSTPSSSASAPPIPRARPLQKTPAKVDCSDPYELDARGRRRYRRECLVP